MACKLHSHRREEIAMNLSIFLESLGCSKNLIDAEIMLGLLNKYGYKLTSNKNRADIIIVNTCGFIEAAKQESINKIIEIGQLKKKNLKLLIVSGCLSERYHKELLEEMPEIDAVVGTGSYDEIVEIINEATNGKKLIRIGDINKPFDESLPRLYSTPHYTTYVKIADGCDNFCTYCIIPKLRGKYRSRRIDDIIKEVKEVVSNGAKEINLIAQDTTRYGIDIYDEYKLPQLLFELNKIEGLHWIRLLYCYPELITEDLIQAIKSCDKVNKYLDIPIQHCSNKILKKMNRKTTKRDITNLIKELRTSIPEIILRTTIIVGFPGEGDEEYLELKEFVKEMQFDKLGVFTYSPEEDTPAAKLPYQVSEEIKGERKKELMQIQQQISLSSNNTKINKVVEVLIEERLDKNGEYMGRTKGDSPEIDGVVYVNSPKTISIGDIVLVKITGALEYDLMGEKVDEFS